MIDKEFLQILQHSIGADQYGQYGPYGHHRNFFGTGPGGKDFSLCLKLVEMGMMKNNGHQDIFLGEYWFYVTPKGINTVELESPSPPKVSRSKARYKEYLNCADCFENFRDFLRYDTGRRKGLY